MFSQNFVCPQRLLHTLTHSVQPQTYSPSLHTTTHASHTLEGLPLPMLTQPTHILACTCMTSNGLACPRTLLLTCPCTSSLGPSSAPCPHTLLNTLAQSHTPHKPAHDLFMHALPCPHRHCTPRPPLHVLFIPSHILAPLHMFTGPQACSHGLTLPCTFLCMQLHTLTQPLTPVHILAWVCMSLDPLTCAFRCPHVLSHGLALPRIPHTPRSSLHALTSLAYTHIL